MRKLTSVLAAALVFGGALMSAPAANAAVNCSITGGAAGAQTWTKPAGCTSAMPRTTFRTTAGLQSIAFGPRSTGTSYVSPVTHPNTITGRHGMGYNANGSTAWKRL